MSVAEEAVETAARLSGRIFEDASKSHGIAKGTKFIAGSSAELGENITAAFGKTGKAISSFGKSGEAPLKGLAAIAWNIVSFPVNAFLFLVRMPIQLVSFAFKKAPVVSTVTTGVAAVGGGATLVNAAVHSNGRDQQRQAMAQAQGYMNSVTPQEYANMQSALQAGRSGGGANFAAVEDQRRAEAAAQPQQQAQA